MTAPDAQESEATANDFGPDTDFARKPAKQTNQPVTEQLFGARGLRVVHAVMYTGVFLIAFAIADLLFATLITLIWIGAQLLDLAIANIQDTLADQFIAAALSLSVVGAAIFCAVIITGFAYYLNETRFNRGEWIRTFL